MPAVTLVEAAKTAENSGETKKSAIIELYARQSDILNAMMFEGIVGNSVKFTQEGELPSAAFRGVNEAYTTSKGSVSNQIEALYIAGGDIDVDKFIVQTMGQQARAREEAMKVKKLSEVVTTKLLKGATSSDPREFDGFQTRLPVTASNDHVVHNSASSGGAALSLAALDQLIDSVAGPTHLIMNRKMKRRFIAAKRGDTSGVMANVQIAFPDVGEPVASYAGIPILTGYGPGKSPAILAFEEAYNGGGSATGTSIYAVRFDETGVVGISNGGIDVRDLGELDAQPVWRTRVEWYLGLAIYDPYSIGRLTSIQDAAIAA